MRTDSSHQNTGQNTAANSGHQGSGHNAGYGGQGYSGQGGSPGFNGPGFGGQNFSNQGFNGQGGQSGGGGRRPVHDVRIGRIKAAIWENHFRDNNGTSYSVTFTKRYKRENQWVDTHSLNRDDLLVAAKVLDLCHSWIVSQENSHTHAGHSATAGDMSHG